MRAQRSAALALLLLTFAAPASFAASTRAPTVILLSLDGVRHDYLQRGELPAFERMTREGSRATALLPVFPSSTFPNQVSLATGASPETHGIIANRFLDPELGLFDYDDDARFLEAEPIWAAAERQGVRSAVFFWAGSGGDFKGHRPSYRRLPFDNSVPERDKVNQIAAWLALPDAARPRLLLSWWHGADGVGHRHGPDHARIFSQLKRQDAQLGRLLRVLDEAERWADTTLVVVSDHGMIGVERTYDLKATLEDAGIAARVFQAGGFANLYLRRPAAAARAVAVLSELDGVSAWPRNATPRALRYDHRRVGDVVALAAPGTALLRRGSALALRRRIGAPFGRETGVHGYDPLPCRAMHGIFLALGRGAPRGHRLGRVRTLDVAATVAKLLGIEAPLHSEGRALPSLAAPTAKAPGSK